MSYVVSWPARPLYYLSSIRSSTSGLSPLGLVPALQQAGHVARECGQTWGQPRLSSSASVPSPSPSSSPIDPVPDPVSTPSDPVIDPVADEPVPVTGSEDDKDLFSVSSDRPYPSAPAPSPAPVPSLFRLTRPLL